MNKTDLIQRLADQHQLSKAEAGRILDTLLDRGRIRAMDARLDAFDVEPLRETARVASVLRERLGKV